MESEGGGILLGDGKERMGYITRKEKERVGKADIYYKWEGPGRGGRCILQEGEGTDREGRCILQVEERTGTEGRRLLLG